MTLYLNLLQKSINDQPRINGVFSFINKVHESLPDYERTSRPTCVQVTNEVVINCRNNPLQVNALTNGVIAKIPVVLAELTVQLNVDSQIDFHEPIYQIYNTKKRLWLTKCILLQNTNVLFIKGYVQNNIEYYKNDGNNLYLKCGNLKHCTVDIPFECTTAILFDGVQPASIIPNSVNNIQYQTQQFNPNSSCQKDPEDYSQFNQISTAFFNERLFCEMVSNKIVELNEIQRSILPFTVIEQKLVIYITLKILQYRQVAIPPINEK